ncbi:MAG TPA: hypothetical protein VNH63_08295 [Gemmatimonadales bacterium]|nr:hypothetical protein [Gemmatimonadales bacterium]
MSHAPNLLAQAGSVVHQLSANRVFCAVNAFADFCTFYGDNLYGNAFWPVTGGSPFTAGQYIFDAGPQIAGVISPSAGFAWAGDTVDALFFDINATQEHGDRVLGVFDSRDTSDVAAWPSAGVIRDAGLYDARLLGRNAASDQDLWLRAWDGNANFLSGRPHPLGIALDVRAMAFNAPEPNKDIVYFAMTFYNVSARDPAAYANPTVPAALAPGLAALGARFQDSSESKFGIAIPDGGYRIDSLYVGLAMDPDVTTEVGRNYTSVVLPFATGFAYHAAFRDQYQSFPLSIFGPPFTKAPGFVGVRFLRSVQDSAPLAMYSQVINSGIFPAPAGNAQVWRYLSGRFSAAAGDGPCTFADYLQRHVCYQAQIPLDVRFYQSTGPFSLGPGEAKTIVVAYLFAAPTTAVDPYIGGDLKPGVPETGDSIVTDPTAVRVIERAAGWLADSDKNGDGAIADSEVTVVPRSLLAKARVAQAMVDHRFVQPAAPDAPAFFLVPGDNQVTVVWQKSPTEATGDPYYAVASNPASVLYDPDYRYQDVEGYRIYRGRDPRAMQLVAQDDYDGTTFVDYTGAFVYPGECAPELGVTTDCPNLAAGVSHPLSYRVVQVPPGGRTQVGGHVFVIQTDTAGAAFPPLEDNGVPFTYVDHDVRNFYTYYYAVTAFDVNAIASGPSSLESAAAIKSVAPRAPSGQATVGVAGPAQLIAADGRVLNPAAPLPTLDSVTGEFSGPMPPTNGITLQLLSFVPDLLTADTVVLVIDSITPGLPAVPDNAPPVPVLYHLTARSSSGAATVHVPIQQDCCDQTRQAGATFPAAHLSAAQATRFGGDSTYALYGSTALTLDGDWRLTSPGRASANADPGNSDFNGPRWWSGSTNENTADPNGIVCAPATGACVEGTLTRNAGAIANVGIFHLQAYSTVPNIPMRDLEGITAGVFRAADFKLYWGANGAVDSVLDVTHGVRVPFDARIGASWGFLNDSSFVGVTPAATPDANNALLTWTDVFCAAPVPSLLTNQCQATAAAVLQNHARLSSVAFQSSTFAGAAGLTATGNGFIFYLAGHFFLMRLAALPGAGTVWSVRYYAGNITGSAAAANFAFPPYTSYTRPPAAPGLRLRIAYTGSILNAAVTADTLLAKIHTVPDPYYGGDALELGAADGVLKFVNLPARCIIRVYSASGILVTILTHDDPTGGGEATWNVKSRNGRGVASGVYFWHVETPDHHQRIGRFTIVTGRR